MSMHCVVSLHNIPSTKITGVASQVRFLIVILAEELNVLFSADAFTVTLLFISRIFASKFAPTAFTHPSHCIVSNTGLSSIAVQLQTFDRSGCALQFVVFPVNVLEFATGIAE